jgi:DNA (cytosine-5)-methyltransferase 1
LQLSILDLGKSEKKITKPIRLIELFAGYGSQALALKYLGVPFEHHKICEWAIPSIKAYKDLHFEEDKKDYSEGKSIDEIKAWLKDRISSDYSNPIEEKYLNRQKEHTLRAIYSDMMATHNLGSICLVHAKDLEITDTDKYEYILTFSFPCQDLSNSGLRKGMSRGSGTRSGMLWEVERILEECDNLPQVLIMENVPEVIGSNNIKDFAQWLDTLERLGYGNYYQVLNATEYKIPQNRRRCFMVSLLGESYYEFPEGRELELRLKDLLESSVDEKYYLSDKAVESFIAHTERQAAKGNGFKFEPTDGGGCAKSVLTTAGCRPCDNYICDGGGVR